MYFFYSFYVNCIERARGVARHFSRLKPRGSMIMMMTMIMMIIIFFDTFVRHKFNTLTLTAQHAHYPRILHNSKNKNSLRSRRLEVAGERENGRARGRHAIFSCAHYFQAPATQARIKSTIQTSKEQKY